MIRYRSYPRLAPGSGLAVNTVRIFSHIRPPYCTLLHYVNIYQDNLQSTYMFIKATPSSVWDPVEATSSPQALYISAKIDTSRIIDTRQGQSRVTVARCWLNSYGHDERPMKHPIWPFHSSNAAILDYITNVLSAAYFVHARCHATDFPQGNCIHARHYCLLGPLHIAYGT